MTEQELRDTIIDALTVMGKNHGYTCDGLGEILPIHGRGDAIDVQANDGARFTVEVTRS